MVNFTRVLAVIAVAFFGLNALAWNGSSSDVSWFSNSKNEYHITTAEQLKGLSDLVLVGNSFEGKTVILDKDIDLDSNPWQPIGSHTYGDAKFNGVFDGRNHKVLGVRPVLSNASSQWELCYGLFGSAGSKSVIKNLTVKGWMYIAPEQYRQSCVYAGGIVGSSNGVVENVQTDFNISAGGESCSEISDLYVGGICGIGDTVVNAKSSGEITLAYVNRWRIGSTGRIGGVVGQGKNINKAQSDCTISVWGNNKTSVGGIIGEGWNCTVVNACFYGSLSVKKDVWYSVQDDYAACSGIVGIGRDSLSVSNCISAPSNYNVEVGKFWLAPIVGDSNSRNWTGSNNYYTLPPNTSDKLGKVTTESKLCSGDSLDGFDTTIWEFKSGELPSIKNVGVGDITSVEYVEYSDPTNFIINGNKILFPNIKANTLVEIYSLDGKKVHRKSLNGNESISLNTGVYVVRIGKNRVKIAM